MWMPLSAVLFTEAIDSSSISLPWPSFFCAGNSFCPCIPDIAQPITDDEDGVTDGSDVAEQRVDQSANQFRSSEAYSVYGQPVMVSQLLNSP